MRNTFILYSYNGLGNQICSLQLAAGLSAYLNDKELSLVYPSNKKQKWSIQDPQDYQVNTKDWDVFLKKDNPSLLDLLDYSFRDNVTVFAEDTCIGNRLDCVIHHCQRSFFSASEGSVEDKAVFLKSKQEIVLDEDKNNIFTYTLSWYSNFFFGRTADMDKEISKIVFKKEYVDLADRISKDLGPYNGAHIRIMRDHHNAFRFTKESLLEGFTSYNSPELPVVVSIDDWNHPLFLTNSTPKVAIHELILTDYYESFKSLEYQNRVVLALISLLVMVRASEFVGTPYSTFTSYIQQQRVQNDTETWKFFPGTNFNIYDPNHKPYSWLSTPYKHSLSWDREWQECKLKYD